MVLAGGPDREREVSLQSGKQVATALGQAGHHVRIHDPDPHCEQWLKDFHAWPGDVAFAALHGQWGEGGGVQQLLEKHSIPYVGCASPAAGRCMDKQLSKQVLAAGNLPTPPFEVCVAGQSADLQPPVVVKPLNEGSSIDVVICQTADDLAQARRRLHGRYGRLLIERFVAGREIAVGIVGGFADGQRALPPVQIVPVTAFYDYEAKYLRQDTRYLFGDQIELPPRVLDECCRLAVAAHHRLGARDLSRVDLIVDRQHQPWILELNTLPGFTSHSLVPMAARRSGLDLPDLVDQLVRLAVGRESKSG